MSIQALLNSTYLSNVCMDEAGGETGGAGGGGSGGTTVAGGTGGSGIVIIRYKFQ